MEHLKKYIKLSMKLLNEGDHYADEYITAKMKGNTTDADMYYSLAQLHMDGYNKIRIPLANYVNQMKKDDPKTMVEEMIMMIREVEHDLEHSIQEKLRK
jgi:uncharacterized short protein YbdD (DUF466 family)